MNEWFFAPGMEMPDSETNLFGNQAGFWVTHIYNYMLVSKEFMDLLKCLLW